MGTLQYKFTYINASNTETIIKDYSTSDSTTWDTTGLAEGSYTVKAIVKDGNSKIVSQKATIKISKAPTLPPTVFTDPIPLVVLILIMFVKLFIRYFELAMLQCVSPVFFACLTGEATKQYFRKFILTYISVVVEVVFMAVIWYVYVEYLNQAFSVSTQANSVLELFSLDGGIMNFFMVSVGAFILMIKPPQVLKNLVTA